MTIGKVDSPDHKPPWLDKVGFRYDPFVHLEASGDPHLGEYIVGHEVFSGAWDGAPALIFAPRGGGKTSMRIYTVRTACSDFGSVRPFPIVHQPANRNLQGALPELDEHLHAILDSAGIALLLDLAYRPERVLNLSARERVEVASFLESTLPAPLARYLRMLESTGSPRTLAERLDRSFTLIDPPSRAKVSQFCTAIKSGSHADRWRAGSPQERLDRLAALLLGSLSYSSVFVLVDGIDALPETAADPVIAVQWLAPVIGPMVAWAQRRILVKAFLPLELRPLIFGAAASGLRLNLDPDKIHDATIVWDSSLLAEVLRRRVYAASGGSYSSLDAFGSPALQDIELEIAQAALPLPREVIVLVRSVLETAAARAGADVLRLEPQDLETAIVRYRHGLRPMALAAPTARRSKVMNTTASAA